jgi:hypothetical protein
MKPSEINFNELIAGKDYFPHEDWIGQNRISLISDLKIVIIVTIIATIIYILLRNKYKKILKNVLIYIYIYLTINIFSILLYKLMIERLQIFIYTLLIFSTYMLAEKTIVKMKNRRK